MRCASFLGQVHPNFSAPMCRSSLPSLLRPLYATRANTLLIKRNRMRPPDEGCVLRMN